MMGALRRRCTALGAEFVHEYRPKARIGACDLEDLEALEFELRADELKPLPAAT